MRPADARQPRNHARGLPLGLAAIRFWSRARFKGTAALKSRINPTRVPIEAKESRRWLANMQVATTLLGDPGRLVHVGDRENDIYEFFCAAQEVGTHFLVRTCVDRLAGDGGHTVATGMAEVAVADSIRSRWATGPPPSSRCAPGIAPSRPR